MNNETEKQINLKLALKKMLEESRKEAKEDADLGLIDRDIF